MIMRAIVVLAVLVASCSRPPEPPALAPVESSKDASTGGRGSETAPVAAPVPVASSPLATVSAAKSLGPEASLEEGLVSFEGLLRPTKGGYEVRGVTFDDSELRRQLIQPSDGTPRDAEWFLGAIVRVKAVLRQNKGTPARGSNGLVSQTREGSFFVASRVDTLDVVKKAETIEGVLSRSKGFFALAGHLVTREDLEWSLVSGVKAGDRVRLRGQSRVVRCEPNAQCLVGGSLPLFDVGRAERLP